MKLNRYIKTILLVILSTFTPAGIFAQNADSTKTTATNDEIIKAAAAHAGQNTRATVLPDSPAPTGKNNVVTADSLYNKKAFGEALVYYQAALEHDGVSSDLYYNIANTYYRLGDLGHAVLNYKRALKLDPSNDDARANLEFVKSQITDKPEDDSTFLSNLHEKITSWFTPDTWAWVAFAIFIIMMTSLALYMFSANVNLRKVGFFGGFILFTVFGYALVIAYQTSKGLDDHETAVVVAASTNLRSTPATSNSKTDKVVPIHEGTELIIIDSLATPDDPATLMWYDVKINNTSRAWVSAADVERI